MSHEHHLKFLEHQRFWRAFWLLVAWCIAVTISIAVIASDHTGYVKSSEVTPAPCIIVTVTK